MKKLIATTILALFITSCGGGKSKEIEELERQQKEAHENTVKVEKELDNLVQDSIDLSKKLQEKK